MLYRLLVVFCIFNLSVSAQDKTKSTLSKATVDYTQIGAPMPDLRVAIFHDTTARRETGTQARTVDKNTRKKMAAFQKLTLITDSDLKSNGNLFVMMFNPNCSHCEAVATSLYENIGLFKKSKIVLLANPVMSVYIPGFLRTCRMEHQTEMYIGTDTAGFVDHVFLYKTLPQINIYNPERRLIKTYTGDVTMDSLKKYID